jgi:predicted nucleotidyltransferase
MTPATKNEAAKLIKTMVKRILERFHPEKVILFGSYAKFNAGPDSDVDLLIVMPVRGSRYKKAVEIGAALHDIDIAKDVIVVTPEEFEWRKNVVGTIEWPAAREGQVLYASA